MPVKTVNDIFLLLENFDVEAEERERDKVHVLAIFQLSN